MFSLIIALHKRELRPVRTPLQSFRPTPRQSSGSKHRLNRERLSLFRRGNLSKKDRKRKSAKRHSDSRNQTKFFHESTPKEKVENPEANERVYTEKGGMPASVLRAKRDAPIPHAGTGTTHLPAYNTPVPALRRHDSPGKHHRRTAYATETFGLLFIAFLIIVIILIRYWHAIHWSWR